MATNDKPNGKTNDKPPAHWGGSEAQFWAKLEGEFITLKMRTGETITGELTGVDTYCIFVERDGKDVMIQKHAIEFAFPGLGTAAPAGWNLYPKYI